MTLSGLNSPSGVSPPTPVHLNRELCNSEKKLLIHIVGHMAPQLWAVFETIVGWKRFIF